jgi:sec-independent protein translocase protein TatB
MFGLGMGELIVLAIVALLFLGPEKLPGAAKALGKGIRDLKRHTRDLQSTLEHDTQIGDAVRDLKSALRGDAPPPRPPAVQCPAGASGPDAPPAAATPAEGSGSLVEPPVAAVPAAPAQPTAGDGDGREDPGKRPTHG